MSAPSSGEARAALLAERLAALATRYLPARALMVIVGVVVVALSGRTILKALA